MRVFLLKNNITDNDTLQKGINLALQKCTSIYFPLEFTQIETTKQFTSEPMTSDVVLNGYEVNPTEIFQEAKQLGYIPALDSITMLIYNWRNINPQPTNPVDNGQVVQLPENWYQTYPEVFCEYALHEICHYLFSATNLPDTTHAYIPAFSQKTRTDYYLYLITELEKPFNALLGGVISPATPFKPDVEILRQSSTKFETLGNLTTLDGRFGCKTLELPYLNNQQNISCIPAGNYQVKKIFSFKFGFVYEVQNVPNRSAIYLHEGNFFFNTKGCILLGSLPNDLNNDGSLDLQNTKLIRQAFQKKMNWQTFNLQIIQIQ